MVRPSSNMRKKIAAITTSLVSFSLACQTCMKKRATRVALTVAMPRATGALNGPKSSVAAKTVRPVPRSRAKKTAKYIFKGDDVECSVMQASRVPVDQVEQGEQINPDNVDEVPVQATNFDGSVPLGREAAFPRHDQKPGENSQADDHVQRMQSRHDEVKRKEHLRMAGVGVFTGMPGDGLVLKTERGAGHVMFDEFVTVFNTFNAEKDHAEKHGENEADD